VLQSVAVRNDTPAVPAEINRLGHRLAAWLASWSDDIAEELFLPNVALDQPYAERKVEFERLTGLLGAPDFGSVETTCGREAVVSQFRLVIDCERGKLRCAVQLGPTTPPRIQKFDLTAEPAD